MRIRLTPLRHGTVPRDHHPHAILTPCGLEFRKGAISSQDAIVLALGIFGHSKINVTGDRTAKLYDEANELADRPTSWKRLPCNAVAQLRGCYLQKQSVGMVLDVAHLQYASEHTEVDEVSPF